MFQMAWDQGTPAAFSTAEEETQDGATHHEPELGIRLGKPPVRHQENHVESFEGKTWIMEM